MVALISNSHERVDKLDYYISTGNYVDLFTRLDATYALGGIMDHALVRKLMTPRSFNYVGCADNLFSVCCVLNKILLKQKRLLLLP